MFTAGKELLADFEQIGKQYSDKPNLLELLRTGLIKKSFEGMDGNNRAYFLLNVIKEETLSDGVLISARMELAKLLPGIQRNLCVFIDNAKVENSVLSDGKPGMGRIPECEEFTILILVLEYYAEIELKGEEKRFWKQIHAFLTLVSHSLHVALDMKRKLPFIKARRLANEACLNWKCYYPFLLIQEVSILPLLMGDNHRRSAWHSIPPLDNVSATCSRGRLKNQYEVINYKSTGLKEDLKKWISKCVEQAKADDYKPTDQLGRFKKWFVAQCLIQDFEVFVDELNKFFN
ncbi:MAG: hypothetical protein ABH832_00695 [bacterium]